jgi:hypothetical protein
MPPDDSWKDELKDELEDARHRAAEKGSRARADNGHDDEPDATELDLEEWDFGEDNEPIPPRGWLLGNLICRQFLASIFGDGAVGKTALLIAMALSLATGRREIIGEHVFVRCRVLLVCFEDGKDELRRRLKAAMMHYGIEKADILGYLFITAISRSDAKLAITDKGRDLQVGKLRGALDRSMVRRRIDVALLDPWIKAHGVPENDNVAVDFAAGALADLIIERDAGAMVPHHTRKGPPDPGNADVGRGAGSLKDAFRLCYTLNPMSEADAELLGVPEDDRASLVRLDNGKVNLVRKSMTPRWFRIVGDSIGNGNETYPSGDEIQVIERWYPPDHFKGVGYEVWNKILDEIDAGLEDGERYSDHPKAKKRQAWQVVARHTEKAEKDAKLIIKTWKRNRVITLESYRDEGERKDRLGFVVDDSKRPGPRGNAP